MWDVLKGPRPDETGKHIHSCRGERAVGDLHPSRYSLLDVDEQNVAFDKACLR